MLLCTGVKSVSETSTSSSRKKYKGGVGDSDELSHTLMQLKETSHYVL